MSVMRKKLLSIVMVLITIIITNFSFALSAKDFSVPMDMDSETIGLMHHAPTHHDNIECEVLCGAMMTACGGCILFSETADLKTINSQLPRKKITRHTSDDLYSVDLPNEQKPPIFS